MSTKITIKTIGGTREYWRKICPSCGKQFFAQRSDAITCGNACRQKLYRTREKNQRKAHNDKCKQLGLPFTQAEWDIETQTITYTPKHG